MLGAPRPKAEVWPANAANPPPAVLAGVVVALLVVPNGLGVPAKALNAPVAGLITEGVDV